MVETGWGNIEESNLHILNETQNFLWRCIIKKSHSIAGSTFPVGKRRGKKKNHLHLTMCENMYLFHISHIIGKLVCLLAPVINKLRIKKG